MDTSGAGPKECPMLQPTSEASPQESSPQGSTSGAGCDFDDDFMSDMVQTMQEAQKIVQAKCTKRLKEKDQNILNLEAKIEELSCQLSQYKTTVASLKDDKQSLEATIEELRCQHSQYETTVASMTDDKQKQRAENDELCKALETLKGKMQHLQQVVVMERRTNKELRDEVDKVKSLKKENDRLSKAMTYQSSRHDTVVQQLREEKERLKTVTSEKQALLEALADEQQKSNGQRKRAEDALRENQALMAAQKEQAKRIDDQTKRAEDALRENQALMAAQKEQAKRIEQEKERVETLMREKLALNEVIAEQKKKNEALHGKVKEHNDTIDKLVDEKELFQAQIGELKSSLVTGAQRIADNEEELMQTQQRLRVVAKFPVRVHTLMQEMGLIDDVKSLSGEGNNMDCTRQPVYMESMEGDHHSQLTSSGKELYELPQLPANLPDVTMDILVFFAPQMGGKWDSIAYALKVGQMATLLASLQQPPDSKCLTVLQTWIEQGPEVTWQKLLDVLWGLGLRSTAIGIYDKLMELANDE